MQNKHLLTQAPLFVDKEKMVKKAKCSQVLKADIDRTDMSVDDKERHIESSRQLREK